MKQTPVAVLGAGIQGTCVALELAARGVQVDLFDRASSAMTGPSLWNEGKIHLGYVYGADDPARTARRMALGSTLFAPFLERWISRDELADTCSGQFNYAVMSDSLVDVDLLEQRYAAINVMVNGFLNESGRRYLAHDGPVTVARLSAQQVEQSYDARHLAAVFRTSERSVDTHFVARTLRQALAGEPRITTHYGTEVQNVSIGNRGLLEVGASGQAGPLGSYRHVVNALWDNRLAIDATCGITTSRPFLFRRKLANHVVNRGHTAAVPSTTMVLGPYGDIVSLPGGKYYLSWYPDGCIDRSQALSPPASWRERPDADRLKGIQQRSAAALAAIAPGVAGIMATADEIETEGGAIFTWGETDIDDRYSELHERHDVGVHTHAGTYHSIDTGKYCLAPMFALDLADRICPLQ